MNFNWNLKTGRTRNKKVSAVDTAGQDSTVYEKRIKINEFERKPVTIDNLSNKRKRRYRLEKYWGKEA